jgi:hypothetical protein
LAGALNCYDFQRPRQVFFMGDYLCWRERKYAPTGGTNKSYQISDFLGLMVADKNAIF